MPALKARCNSYEPARQVIAVDLSPEKLAFARTLGATDTVMAGIPNAVKQVRDLSFGCVHYFFDMAGSVTALDLAYITTGRSGSTGIARLPHPDHKLPPG